MANVSFDANLKQTHVPSKDMMLSCAAREWVTVVNVEKASRWSTVSAATNIRKQLALPSRSEPEASIYQKEHRAPYMVDGWHEQQGWHLVVSKILDQIATDSRTVLSTTEAELFEKGRSICAETRS